MARKPRVRGKKSRKGIVGIEAAIVLIAFVLVASALAFVVLNMGMFTTQKSKEVIARAYEESTRALDVAGSVMAYVQGYTDPSTAYVDSIVVPIKLTAGARAIDLNKTAIRMTIILPDGTAKQIDNAFVFEKANYNVSGTIYADVQRTYVIASNLSNSDLSSLVSFANLGSFQATWLYSLAGEEIVKSYSTNTSTLKLAYGDNLLEPGEIVLLVAKVSNSTANFTVGAYSRIIIEIQPPEGSTLTIERVVPASLTSEYVNLDIG